MTLSKATITKGLQVKILRDCRVTENFRSIYPPNHTTNLLEPSARIALEILYSLESFEGLNMQFLILICTLISTIFVVLQYFKIATFSGRKFDFWGCFSLYLLLRDNSDFTKWVLSLTQQGLDCCLTGQ